MTAINRNTIQAKLIHELFELLNTNASNEIRELAIDELIRRGYTLDDIHIIRHSKPQ